MILIVQSSVMLSKSISGTWTQLNFESLNNIAHFDSLPPRSVVIMPGCSDPGVSNTGVSRGVDGASQRSINPANNKKGEVSQESVAELSGTDREKMSAYVTFVDSQAKECLERLNDEVNRDSRGT